MQRCLIFFFYIGENDSYVIKIKKLKIFEVGCYSVNRSFLPLTFKEQDSAIYMPGLVARV
jgi:hypothetical protein